MLTTTLSPIESELLTDFRALMRRGWGEITVRVEDHKVVSMHTTTGKAREYLNKLQTQGETVNG